MRRRLPALRRRDPRTPDPEPETSALEPSETTPVAWAPEEPAPSEEQPSEAPETTAFTAVPEPETTVFPTLPGPDADAAPGDAVAAPPLEVRGVQPDGTVLPPPDPSAPAGVEPGAEPGPDEPGFRIRGRLRRRLRYLRRVRELGLRDLGGLVFDLHRFGREGDALIAGKLVALSAVDDEIRVLEESLDDRRELVVLREPGLAACPRCAALHGSDANFCPSCGLPFGGVQPAVAAGPPLAPIGVPPVGPSSVTAAHLPLDPHGRPPGPS